MAGLFESVLMRNFQLPHPALVSEKKIKKGRVAPALYVHNKKWKVILRFDTSNTAQLDPEYRKYYQY
jgi:hypothetical protein